MTSWHGFEVSDEGCIVAVTGGRDYMWSDHDTDMLVMLLAYHSPIGAIWHGGATGVDEHVDQIAGLAGIPRRVFLPDPVLLPTEIVHSLIGRNARMMAELDAAIRHEGRRGVLFGFPGKDGTANCIGHALRRSIHTVDLRSRIYRTTSPT